ncbi:hypothetical protein PR048_008807 [Dryococelus australis]|uniref:ERAP1-like C-terminal domain-containing protein n=1 Tax=Dryococelus australis TaxID=614101 RepID=A0ABQ9HY66_9NEOP|nr:hypothetical protein PR048_008807 [Dryococelus australis]
MKCTFVSYAGFYRVQYDTENWRLLILQLDSDQMALIPAVNRAQILNDAFNLARAGSLNYHIVTVLLRYLSRETDYIPWQAALQGLSYLTGKLKASPDYAVFKVTYITPFP